MEWIADATGFRLLISFALPGVKKTAQRFR
jgi:hypothetical protein